MGSALSWRGWKADLSALTVPPHRGKTESRELRSGGISPAKDDTVEPANGNQ